MGGVITEELGEATGYEAITPDTVKSITTTLVTPTSGNWKNNTAQAALITVETAPIRFRLEGVASSTNGHKMDAGQSYVVMGSENVKSFNCIDVSAASSVKVTVFHKP